ncbi:MAG: helicase [Bacteroidetes bacterium GWA2_30_7]|nr:MAG: helicase [Bacteroidetes bacterium GWA2_30_7]
MSKKASPKIKTKKEVKVSYHKKPENLTLENWQIALRKQIATEQIYEVENIGESPVFSDFLVTNHQTKNTYKVAIRDVKNGLNFCSCPDFKTNLLGTCKHIEYLIQSFTKSSKLKKIMKAGFHPEYSSLSLRYGTERKIHLRIGSENKSEIQKLSSKYFDNENFLTENSFYKIENFINEVKLLNPTFRAYPDAIDFIIDKREKKRREEIISTNYSDKNSLDSLIQTKLYPYQKHGVLFAAKAGRCLIADEMGLGKTIQSLATCELLIKEFQVEKILIVCPTSLKYQWKSEIKKFTGKNALVIEGSPLKRRQKYYSEEVYKIVSYHVIKNDNSEIKLYNPDLVILDEAQRIKNWKTQIAQSVKSISSKYALVLTGTPLENKIEEIHSIMQFVDNFRLGPLYKFLNYHQVKDEFGKVIGYEHLNDINKSLSDVLVRRTKKEIADQLPERIDNNYFVQLTPQQLELHTDYYDNVCRLVDKWRRFGFLSEEDRQKLLILLGCMRMVSDSTYILDQKTRYDTKIGELVTILKEIFERDDQKVVIFSQWERMTRLVSFELENMGIKYEYLHGGIASEKRGVLLDNFRENPESRVFLSTDAGGTGLNLQSANYVINLDIPWNPAILEQRIARVHRLGQKNTVNVINFISENSIEQRILALLGFKRSVFEGVLDLGDDSVFMNESRFTQLMKTVENISEIQLDCSQEDDINDAFEDNIDIPEKETIHNIDSEKSPQTDNNIDTKITVNIENEPIQKEQSNEPNIGDLIAKGIDFLTQLTASLKQTESGKNNGHSNNNGFVKRDEKTGEKYLKIPLTDEKLVSKITEGISAFLEILRK